MRKLAFFLFAVLVISCKKDKSEIDIRGVWVEKTLGLDTMDIGNFLASDPQSIYFKSQQSFTGYWYRLKTDSILLQQFGTFTGFNPYYFNFSNAKEFTISNFFQRPGLPATVQFRKIN